MAEVKNGDTVKIHYTGKLDDGNIFDSSKERDPLQFVVGSGQVIPGFDEGVMGMTKGEAKTINIASEKAYGKVQQELIASVPIDKMPKEMEVKVGQMLEIQQPNGQSIPVTITQVTDTEVTIDANHSLAGKDLTFEVELVDIV